MTTATTNETGMMSRNFMSVQVGINQSINQCIYHSDTRPKFCIVAVFPACIDTFILFNYQLNFRGKVIIKISSYYFAGLTDEFCVFLNDINALVLNQSINQSCLIQCRNRNVWFQFEARRGDKCFLFWMN